MLLAFSSGRGLHPPNLIKEFVLGTMLHHYIFSRKSLFLKLLESGLNKKKKNLVVKERMTTDKTESLNSSQSVPQSAIKG